MSHVWQCGKGKGYCGPYPVITSGVNNTEINIVDGLYNINYRTRRLKNLVFRAFCTFIYISLVPFRFPGFNYQQNIALLFSGLALLQVPALSWRDNGRHVSSTTTLHILVTFYMCGVVLFSWIKTPMTIKT